MLNRRDTYRSYLIWAFLLIFYGVFYFASNYAWVNELNVDTGKVIISSQNTGTEFSTEVDSSKSDTFQSATISSADSQKVKATEQKTVLPHSKPFQVPGRKKIIFINTANQDQWELLYNIGPYRANKIIKFRTALGGFYSVEQVGETYGLPDSVFRKIKPQLRLNGKIKRVKINTMSYDSLYLHPYITKQMAYYIAKYRNRNDPLKNINDLYAFIKEKDHERLRKLEPYLEFDIK